MLTNNALRAGPPAIISSALSPDSHSSDRISTIRIASYTSVFRQRLKVSYIPFYFAFLTVLYSALSFRAQALQIMEGVEEMEVMYQRCMKVSESTDHDRFHDQLNKTLSLLYCDVTGWSLVTSLVMKISVGHHAPAYTQVRGDSGTSACASANLRYYGPDLPALLRERRALRPPSRHSRGPVPTQCASMPP